MKAKTSLMSKELISPPIYHKSGRIAKKAISKIQEILTPEEKVIAAGDAYYKGAGAWVVTNKRLLFASKGLFTWKLTDIPREKITGVNAGFGPLLNKIEISAGTRSLTLDHLKPKPANELSKALNS